MEGGHVQVLISADIKISVATLKGDENRSSDSNTLSWFDHRARCSLLIPPTHQPPPLLFSNHPQSSHHICLLLSAPFRFNSDSISCIALPLLVQSFPQSLCVFKVILENLKMKEYFASIYLSHFSEVHPKVPRFEHWYQAEPNGSEPRKV